MNIKQKITKFSLCTAVLLCILHIPAKTLSHPHVFITKQAVLYFDKKGLTGIHNIWEFDEIFSQSIISEYDLNKNGKFEESEKKDVYKNAFINIQNFNYYTFIIYNKKQIHHKGVENFLPRIVDGALIYEFTIPLNIKASKKEANVEIFIADETYFIDFSKFVREDIVVKAPENIAVRYGFAEAGLENEWGGEYTNVLDLYFKER